MLDPLELIPQNASVLCFNLIWLWQHLDTLNPMVGHMMDLLLGEQTQAARNAKDGEQDHIAAPFKPHVHREFCFEDALAALRCLQAGKTIGKVVLTVQ